MTHIGQGGMVDDWWQSTPGKIAAPPTLRWEWVGGGLSLPGADPGFVERGGAAATASAAGAKVFGGSRLKTLFGISKGGAHAPCAPLNPLVFPVYTVMYMKTQNICIGMKRYNLQSRTVVNF